MDVKEFLNHFKDDIKYLMSIEDYLISLENYLKTANDYPKRHLEFYKKTLPFQISAKQSFFELSYKIIDEERYDEYFEFGIFAHLGLFTNDDTIKFGALLNKVSEKLSKIDNTSEMENALSFIHTILDTLFHEGSYIKELSPILLDLKSKIEMTKKLDPNEFREMPLRFIDYIQYALNNLEK